MFIGPCIIVIVEELKTNFMSLVTSSWFLIPQLSVYVPIAETCLDLFNCSFLFKSYTQMYLAR